MRAWPHRVAALFAREREAAGRARKVLLAINPDGTLLPVAYPSRQRETYVVHGVPATISTAAVKLQMSKVCVFPLAARDIEWRLIAGRARGAVVRVV